MNSSRFLLIIGFIAVAQLSYATEIETAKKQPDCRLIRCSNYWDPVCAWDGNCYKTFTNACQVLVTNCDRKPKNKFRNQKPGECTANDVPSCNAVTCPDACMDLYDPVCGYNGNEYKTFSNQCYMNMENCQNPGPDYVTAYQRECDTGSPTATI